MSTADASNIWVSATITLKHKEDNTSLAVTVSNRVQHGETAANIATDRYYPILKEVRGVGGQVTGPLPSPGTGSIILSDENNQLDNFRKFSDLLDRYAIINSTCAIKYDLEEEGDNAVRGTLSNLWTSKVKNVAIRRANNSHAPGESFSTISIELQSRGVQQKVITKAVSENNFSSAPEKSLGKHLPVVFGQYRECPGIRVTADDSSTHDYAYATTFGVNYVNDRVELFFAKDDAGEFQTFSGAASTSTELNGYALDGNKAQDIYAQEEIERAYEINPSTTYIITQGHFYLYTSRSGPNTEGVFNIREDDNGSPGRVVRQAKFDFSTTSGTGEQKIEFAFSKPLVMDAEKTWYFGFSVRDEQEDTELQSGDFSSGAGWTANTGWSISGGQAHFNSAATSNRLAYQTPPLQVGTQYRMTGEITNWSGSGRAGISNACLEASKADRTVTDSGNIDVVGIAKQEQYEFFGRASSGTLSFDVDNVTATPLGTSVYPYTSTVDSATCWFLAKDAGSQGERVWFSNSSPQPYFALYGVAVTDTTTPSTSELDQHGLGHSYVTLSQKSAPSNFTAPDLGDLNLVFSVFGLTDDSGGTITGASNTLLTKVHHCVELLTLEHSGSGVFASSSDWDFLTFSSTHTFASSGNLVRNLQGRTEGRATFESFLADICSQHQSKIVMTSAGKFALYMWGEKQSSKDVLTDDDINLQAVDMLGTSTVINSVEFYYDKGIVNAEIVNAVSQGGAYRDYRRSLFWDGDTNAESGELVGINDQIYGLRELAKDTFDLVTDDGAAETVAKYYLGVFRAPHVYATLQVPLEKAATYELMDVVEILSPELMTYFGTSANALLPHYDSDPVDLLRGHHWKRGKRYRAQIEGKEISYQKGEFPLVTLRVRLLTNFPQDPT